MASAHFSRRTIFVLCLFWPPPLKAPPLSVYFASLSQVKLSAQNRVSRKVAVYFPRARKRQKHETDKNSVSYPGEMFWGWEKQECKCTINKKHYFRWHRKQTKTTSIYRKCVLGLRKGEQYLWRTELRLEKQCVKCWLVLFLKQSLFGWLGGWPIA